MISLVLVNVDSCKWDGEQGEFIGRLRMCHELGARIGGVSGLLIDLESLNGRRADMESTLMERLDELDRMVPLAITEIGSLALDRIVKRKDVFPGSVLYIDNFTFAEAAFCSEHMVRFVTPADFTSEKYKALIKQGVRGPTTVLPVICRGNQVMVGNRLVDTIRLSEGGQWVIGEYDETGFGSPQEAILQVLVNKGFVDIGPTGAP